MRKIRTWLAGLLIVCCVLNALVQLGVPASAASKQQTPQRAIAVVFDNSGSMYTGDSSQSKAWCRATYGMEVFAAMMNPGDVLEIYPMSPVEVEGKSYTQDNPLVISDEKEVSKIREIYTPSAGATPIETVSAAYEGLSKYKGKEQWLMLLLTGPASLESLSSTRRPSRISSLDIRRL